MTTASTEDTRARLRTDRAALGAYVSDASIFRRVPRAVLEPRTLAEIRAGVLIAQEEGWPITVRGGGTSVAGNGIGEGLIIDTSRHFNRILDIDPEARTARIEPGVVCDALREAAAPYGLTYGPDPSTHSRCTVGGMIANNACGSHSLAWGTAADNVVELTVMRADGELVTLKRGGTSDPELDRALMHLRDENLALLRTTLGRFPRQVSGYGLHHLLPENGFDTAKAFAGSEGTLGIIVEALVQLVPTPTSTALAVLAFPTVFDAAAAAPQTRRPGVVTSEGMGGDLLDVLRISQGRDAGDILPGGAGDPRPAGGWLYCETTGETADEARMRAEELVAEFDSHSQHRTVDAVVVADRAEMRKLWRIRESAAGLVTRLPDGGEAWPNWEDSAVPPEQLADYLRDLYALLDQHGLRGIPFGHFGEGCVHIRISFDLGTEDGLDVFRAFMSDAAATVASHGGSLSGEHGDGRARSALLSQVYPPEALAAFATFKTAFDPDGALNPGVLVDPDAVDTGIRPAPGQRSNEFIPVHALSRDRGSLVNAVNRCVGVGACRSDEGAMCPSFQITRDEVHSTRGRARLLSEMFRGDLHPEGTRSEDVKDALDLCLSCRACASECPVNVDMATYKSEFLHQHYADRRRPMSHYSMGWLPLTSRVLHLIPGAARAVNALLSTRPLEKAAMRLGGVDATRSMIRFSPRSFQSLAKSRRFRAERSGSASTSQRAGERGTVVLWPDSFTNHLDTDVASDAHVVLTALGYDVVVPRGFLCCGLTWHSTGQLTRTQQVLTRTLTSLESWIDGRTPIVVLEPSCASMLTEEAPELLATNPLSHRLAEQVVTLGDIVADHVDDPDWPFGELPVPALSQVHCHERSRRGHGGTATTLARLGVAEAEIETGCCGLAGNWGFEPGHADLSRGLAERELLPRIRELDQEAVVLADGYSCRTQIREGLADDRSEHAPKRGLHLAQLLRRALGTS
ncbi:FAD-binding and (Fe-S)-binding domain-containing protein [Saccharopolyspora mangrovi]|uniref:FAD-binding and (Fe-S)-binding domain-containing protein n=1 Tax=Saccharopolyspora mangrovi TaxID=3082379 RepID=A0ABU6A4L2_9PSEU|nr:FAD-binding and (Fe-S)-binding domain-containing protein [Saccharopolyspora sp. S2-29]MEB3366395.1 FAD-binding and (Fe-S)-binding domain-containing protein [Saccharopolyspora sp. S2-29]